MIFFYSNKLIEWAFRILVSVNLLLAGLNYDDRINYPMNCLVLTLVALWLYFFKLKWPAIPFLIMALFINYLHIGVLPQ